MRDSDIPTIFNPRRVRTPSVVVTGDEQPRGSVPNGPFTSSARLQHTDSGRSCSKVTCSSTDSSVPSVSKYSTDSIKLGTERLH
jgi:hypothetical protein